jgi:histone H3/H4
VSEKKFVIVVSKLKEYVKEKKEKRISEEAIIELDERIKAMVERAADAADSDKRGTIKARDFE